MYPTTKFVKFKDSNIIAESAINIQLMEGIILPIPSLCPSLDRSYTPKKKKYYNLTNKPYNKIFFQF